MDLKEEKTLGGDPTRHWYYITKGRAIQSLLCDLSASSLIDVGAGSGVFAKMLVAQGLVERAVCVDPNYDYRALGTSSDGRIVYTRGADKVDADLVMMIDVIEHVDDDIGLVRQYAECAAPGTRFLIAVPAFQFLWSSHDEFLEHKRRYTLESLERTVRAAGLLPLKKRYFFGLVLPIVAALRVMESKSVASQKTSQLKMLPNWLNYVLIKLHDIERRTLFRINKFLGVTAFCLAEKPAAAAMGAETPKAARRERRRQTPTFSPHAS